MRKKLKTGVYAITCVATGKKYIGSAAKSLASRRRQHYCELRKNRHHTSKLQNAWNKYGESSFRFDVLLYCRPDDCVMYEQLAMDAYKPELNIKLIAASSLGHKMSDEKRLKFKTRPQSQAKLYEVNGEKLTVPELATKYKVSVSLIYQRLRKGISGDELVVINQEPDTIVDVDGVPMTFAQIAKAAGLPDSTIHTRYRKGVRGAALLSKRKHTGGRRKVRADAPVQLSFGAL